MICHLCFGLYLSFFVIWNLSFAISPPATAERPRNLAAQIVGAFAEDVSFGQRERLFQFCRNEFDCLRTREGVLRGGLGDPVPQTGSADVKNLSSAPPAQNERQKRTLTRSRLFS